MTSLAWRNIVCIPSIHGKIPFASEVRDELDRQEYDCIAVELSEKWGKATLEAVKFLPRITGVTNIRSGFVVMPGDSLMEGVYQGWKRGIATEFVDAEVECEYSQELLPSLPDSYTIQAAGLPRYFDLAKSVFHTENAPPAHHIRNRHMAFRLTELAARHRRVLFICGAAHWSEILELLERGGGEEFLKVPLRVFPRVVHFDHNCILNISPWNGEIPFYRLLYFQGVSNAESVIAQLLDGAARNYRYPLGVREMEKVLQYAARLARLEPALTPSLHAILSAARDIVGASFADEVLRVAFSYPSQNDFSKLETCLRTVAVPFQPRGWRPATDGFDLVSVLTEFGEKERRNPKVAEGEQDVQFSEHSWGRYADEMEREDAFLKAIVAGYLQSTKPENDRPTKFEGDLKGGLDARETLRARLADPSSRAIYVKEEDAALKDDVGAVVLLFDADEETHNSSCYTYGRHLALGFVTPPDRSGATAKVRWGLLCSFLQTYQGAEKRAAIEQIRNGEIDFDNYEQCLLQTLHFARKPRILYVATQPPEAWVEDEARDAGKLLSFIPISSLPETLVEEIRTYNVYFYPEPS